MSQGSEAAEQMTRETLRITETVAKLTAAGAKNLGVLLAALMKDNIKIKGKTNLNAMLREGRELKVFPIQGEYLKDFAEEARKYGILFSVIKDNKAEPPTFDILARAEDVSKINRVMERIGYPIPGMGQAELKKTAPQEGRSGRQRNGSNTSRTAMTAIETAKEKIARASKPKTTEKER